LQQAEVARGQAEVKAQEERRRRRVTLALAGAVVGLVLGGSATGWWYLEQAAQQQRRLGEAQKGIEASLSEASKLREAGLQQVDNPAAWGVTLAAARTALEHARTLLSQEPDLAETALAQQARQAQAQLEADQKDWQLLAVYDQVRLEQSQWDRQRRRFKKADSYPRLAQALADYGLAIGGLEPGQAVERLRQRPPAVQKQLLALLEECRARAPAEATRATQWLAAVLALEADLGLAEFRKAVAQRAWAQVARLVGQMDVSRYHPAVLVGLAITLPEKAGASAVLLLRRAQQQYPGDFWVNYLLGVALSRSILPSAADRPAREELPVLSEAVGFYRVAVGLRPGSAPAHNDLGVALDKLGDLAGATACFQKALQLDPKLPQAHHNLGNVLLEQGDLAGAIARYRKAIELDPEDAQAHNNLGHALSEKGDLAGAIPCFQKALNLAPTNAKTHHNLGLALHRQGDLKGAITCYRQALELNPRLAETHNNLGNALKRHGNLKGAIECYWKAVDLDPKYAPGHTNLGLALGELGDQKGAEEHFQKALALDPRNAPAQWGLGIGRAGQGDLNGAIGHFRKALEIDPRYAPAHAALGRALAEQGDPKGAMASYTRALELAPKDVQAHDGLGLVLMEQGDLKGAIEHFHKAVELAPKEAPPRYHLGGALRRQGDLNGAIACYQKLLDLDPKNAEAQCNLGQALRKQGHFAKALEALKRGHQLGSQRPGWPYPSARWVEDCQRLLALDTRLPAILKGEDQPADADEQLALAEVCRCKKRFAAAARFYAAAFAAQPKFAENVRAWVRYNAACAAALASCGEGRDADTLEAKERAGLRGQALDWLRADLVAWSRQLADADARTRKAAQQILQHWQKDPDLASVRGKEALAKLPEAERAAWQQLWAEVETLLKKTHEGTK
jgi:tetratricopeptide (TPR) repeat protein